MQINLRSLGKISIHSEMDVISFRNKLLETALMLSNDVIYSTKIAASASSFCKYMMGFYELDINVTFEESNANKSTIKLDFGELPVDFEMNDIPRSLLFGIGLAHVEEKLVIGFSYAFDIRKFEEAWELFNVKTVDELMEAVKIKNAELESSLANLKDAKDLNARMEGELEVGQNIQMSMLPANEFSNDELDVYAYLAPAREVGGDFYDFFSVDEEHVGFVVGDVSGKGVPAALMMAVCKTYIKSYSSGNPSTAEIITKVNNEMAKENANYMFVTVFMAVLNVKTGQLTYTNAGHNPTYIRRADGALEKLGTLHGPVVAAMEGIEYKESAVVLELDDNVFMYTDGIPEAHNDKGEMFTDASLANFLVEEKFVSSRETVESIVKLVEEFENGADRFDDITALCLDYHGSTSKKEILKTITIKNNISEIQSVIDYFELFGEENGLAMPVVMKLNIAIDEFIGNTIKYAFEGSDTDHEIEIQFHLSEGNLTMTLVDDGIEFDPFGRNPPDTTLGIEDRDIGGLGIHITKKIMDDYSYARQNGINTITLVKNNVL